MKKIIVPYVAGVTHSMGPRARALSPLCLGIPQLPSIFPELCWSLPRTSLSPSPIPRPLGLEKAPKFALGGIWKAACSAVATQEQAQRVLGCSQPHMGTDRRTRRSLHPRYSIPEKDAVVFGVHRG